MKTKYTIIACFFIIIFVFFISGCAIIPGFGRFSSDDELANYALETNGGLVSASNYTPGHNPFTVINGITSSDGWDDGEGWECKFDRQRPRTGGWSRLDPRTTMDYGSAWIEVQFKGPRLINKVNIYTLDSKKYPAYRYGIQEAWLQLWKENGWTIVGEISGGAIVSKANLDRQPAGGKMTFKFDPVKTDKLRFVVFRSNDSVPVPERWTDEIKIDRNVARVIEIEATGLEKISKIKESPKPRLDPAPEIVLPNLNGEWIRLSNFKGQIVIVTFWAEWSPQAKSQVYELNALYNQYKDQDVVVIGISVDEGGAERIRPFVKQSNLNYTILIADTSTKTAYGGIGTLPSTFVINQEGNIYSKYAGYQGRHILELDIKKLMSEP